MTQLNSAMLNLKQLDKAFYTVQIKENKEVKKTIIHTDNKVATYDKNGKLISICMGV